MHRACLPRVWRRLAGAAFALSLASTGAAAEPAEIAKRRATERTVFSNAEIVDGFFKLTFGAEYQLTGQSDRIRKFDGPVRVGIDNRARPDRSPQVMAAVADIGRRIEHIDLAMAPAAAQANLKVTLVRDRDLGRTLRSIFGNDRARSIQKQLDPQCLSSFRRDENFRIASGNVVLVTDAGEFVFYDCMYEELLQALGPINDDPTLRWSMFNDRVHLGFFGVFDQYILNILYHPLVRPGMTRVEAEAVLPQVLPDVRAFVAKTNGLKN